MDYTFTISNTAGQTIHASGNRKEAFATAYRMAKGERDNGHNPHYAVVMWLKGEKVASFHVYGLNESEKDVEVPSPL